MLAVGGVLAASAAVAFGAAKTGLPALVAFLGLGMVLGSDEPGGIAFDDAQLAREVGVVSLAAILYEGGLSTSWRRLREVATPALLLSTVGVVVTAAVTGAAAYGLFDLSWTKSLLLGAVVASIDAAAVFATLRHTVYGVAWPGSNHRKVLARRSFLLLGGCLVSSRREETRPNSAAACGDLARGTGANSPRCDTLTPSNAVARGPVPTVEFDATALARPVALQLAGRHNEHRYGTVVLS
jgi:hypothetical protein